MKLFRTSDISVIAYCRQMFQFDLPSAILKNRAEKFDSVSLNWHYIELLVKILCIVWFIVSFYIMYRVRFEPERTGTPFRSFSAYSCKI